MIYIISACLICYVILSAFGRVGFNIFFDYCNMSNPTEGKKYLDIVFFITPVYLISSILYIIYFLILCTFFLGITTCWLWIPYLIWYLFDLGLKVM